MSFLRTFVAFSSWLLCVYGCSDLSGEWRNQLGSNMTIFMSKDGQRFTGEYRTAVESQPNAALMTSNITGVVKSMTGGSLLSFTVLFNHGNSLATWVGQCLPCGGEEKLFTSWLLRRWAQKPRARWMTSMIGQDTFTRTSHDISLRHEKASSKLRSSQCEKTIGASEKGFWVSESGEAFKFSKCRQGGEFTGQHSGNEIVGRSDGKAAFTAMGILSSETNKVKGFTGHIYDETRERKRGIETSWLEHEFTKSCSKPLEAVRFGMDTYTFAYKHKGDTNAPATSTNLMQRVSNIFSNVYSYFAS